ncbi:MAG: xylose isomerase [Bifidobacteriaceae bacterium]|jgi:xylose isomerase|nr:xylose isomerase [Bifidobacteriaceae bacterium]
MSDIKFSVGLWTVNWGGADPFGTATRHLEDNPIASVYKLAELGVDAFTFHDNDIYPIEADSTFRQKRINELKKAMQETGIICEMVTTNTFSDPLFKDGAFTSPSRNVRRFGLKKIIKQIDLGAELGATTFVMWGGREGTEYDNSKDLYDSHARYAEGIDTVAAYIKQKGYNMRIALEPKPNEPRGDIFLPTIGHALALIGTLDNKDIVGLNPEVGHEQMATLNFTHGIGLAMYCDKLFHIDLNGQNGPRYDQDLVFGHGNLIQSFFTVDLLDNGSPNGGIKPYTGYRHFDYKPSRTETTKGVWESVIGNMKTYKMLSQKAKAYRADPRTQDLFAQAGYNEINIPTLAPNESISDFLAKDQSFSETSEASEYDRGYVQLHQIALEHLIS